MNGVFFWIILIAITLTGYRQLVWIPPAPDSIGPMQALTTAMIEAAKGSVTLALGLIGVMAFFLGLMKVAEAGGLLQIIARLVRPMMVRLFPDVPPDHPAMGAMIMNLSANALGLGNAATPFGIRAMQELDRLNPHKGTATNAMVLFLAINTSSVTLLPTGIIALRAAAGSHHPAAILPSTLFATICSTTAAILSAKCYQRLVPLPTTARPVATMEETLPRPDKTMDGRRGFPGWVSGLALLALVAAVPLAVRFGPVIGPWIIPMLTLVLLGFGWLRRIRVYEVFVEGARDGFEVAVKIIPYLVAILVAVAMFRSSGAMDLLVGWIGTVTSRFGMPAEALPMALLRPLSGSGAYGLVAAIINNPQMGPDSYTGFLVSTLQGSTETTFYVIAVYFGAIQVKRMRHALAAGLTADLAGILAAVAACTYLFSRT